MKNQIIQVFYQNEAFMVDFNKLQSTSSRFSQLIKPYVDNGTEPQRLQLTIRYNKFSPRNVSNFLKMSQGMQNDVHPNEIPEICEIAKMFGNENIYNKSLSYIHSRIDPNFSVSNNFNDSNGDVYMSIELVKNMFSQHAKSLNELQFNEEFGLPEPKIDDKLSRSANKSTSSLTKIQTACYKIQILNPFMKCCRYIFSKEGRILFTGKQRANEIFIGKGNDVHIHENKSDNFAQISQNSDGYNIVNTDDQQFNVTYVPIGTKKQYSIKTGFNHQGRMLDWSPKDPNTITNYNGEFNHLAIPSKKNTILKNPAGKPTFIFRKMAKNTFEMECSDSVNPLIVFSIGLSQVVGPVSF